MNIIFLDTNMILAKDDFKDIDKIKLDKIKHETIFRGTFIKLVDLEMETNDISIKYTKTIFEEVSSQLFDIKKSFEENKTIDSNIKQIIISKIDNSISYINGHNNNGRVVANDESTVNFVCRLKSQNKGHYGNDLSISIEINNFIDINENLNKNNVVLLTNNLKHFSEFKCNYSLNKFENTNKHIKISKIEDVVNYKNLLKMAKERIISFEGEVKIDDPVSGIGNTFYSVKYSKIGVKDDHKSEVKEITYLSNLKMNYDIIQGSSRIEKYIYIDAIHFKDEWKITNVRGFGNRIIW